MYSEIFRRPWGNPNFCYTPRYQSAFRPIKGLIKVIEIFGIGPLDRNREALSLIVQLLEEPAYMMDRELFEHYFDDLVKIFSNQKVKKMIVDKLSILNPEEIDRLNEAIHCFLEDCNYSTVAISVSAIEFRLLTLMSSVCPHEASKLEEFTLGRLVNEYLEHKEKYGNVIPKKHEPLLEYCNTYRIFSVHPKKEKITKSVATSILEMTFQFLLDKRLILKK